jgi:hypothetical protein
MRSAFLVSLMFDTVLGSRPAAADSRRARGWASAFDLEIPARLGIMRDLTAAVTF